MTALRLPNPLVSLALTGLLAITATTASADTPAQAVVGGTIIHTVRTSWGGLTPQQRADQIQQRLVTALSHGPVYPKDITIGQVYGDWCVLFQGKRFLTADPLTVQEEHANPQVLVGEWAAHLRQVLPDLTHSK